MVVSSALMGRLVGGRVVGSSWRGKSGFNGNLAMVQCLSSYAASRTFDDARGRAEYTAEQASGAVITY